MKVYRAIVIALLLFLSILGLFAFNRSSPIVYVDIGKLQEGYKMKQELETKANSRLLTIKNIIDSLYMVKRISPVTRGYTRLDTSIAKLEYELNRSITDVNKELTQKVWDRLNVAIEKFGKEHDYSIIIGANGAGTVLYGEERKDITKQLIDYVNKNYETGK